MTFVIGRGDGDGPSGRLGSYRALDGSDGAPVRIDLDGPHAVLIVGKRGYGKSYTLGVVAEELARSAGVAPVIVDPMGVFTTLAAHADGDPVPAEVIETPAVAPSALDPRSWCALLGLSAEAALVHSSGRRLRPNRRSREFAIESRRRTRRRSIAAQR